MKATLISISLTSLACVTCLHAVESASVGSLSSGFAASWPMTVVVNFEDEDVSVPLPDSYYKSGAWGFEIINALHDKSPFRVYPQGRAMHVTKVSFSEGCNLVSELPAEAGISLYTFYSTKLRRFIVSPVYDPDLFQGVSVVEFRSKESIAPVVADGSLFFLDDTRALELLRNKAATGPTFALKIQKKRTKWHAVSIELKSLLANDGKTMLVGKNIKVVGYLDGKVGGDHFVYTNNGLDATKATFSLTIDGIESEMEFLSARIAVGSLNAVTSKYDFINNNGRPSMDVDAKFTQIIDSIKDGSRLVALIASENSDSNVEMIVEVRGATYPLLKQ